MILYILVILKITLQKDTYIQFDEGGLQKIIEIALNTISNREIQFSLDYEVNFILGKLSIHDINITSISNNTNQISLTFNEKLNGLQVDINIQQFIANANITLKILGINTIKEISSIRVKNTKLKFLLLLDSNDDGALRISLNKNKFDTFKLGKIKILSGSKWYQKLINLAMNPTINLFIRSLQKHIGKTTANFINQYGQQIPNEIVFPKPLDTVKIDISQLQKPKITQNYLFLDFKCGNDEPTIFQETEQNYLNFKVSKYCINNIIQQIWQINDFLDINVIAQQISDITEIDSKTLSKLFPEFYQFEQPKDVTLQIGIDNIQEPLINFNQGYIQANLPFSMNIGLLEIQRIKSLQKGIIIDYNQKQQQEQEYYTQFNFTAQINLQIRKENKGFIGDILQLDITNINLENEEKFNIIEWNNFQNVGLKFGQSYANQVIYNKMIKPETYFDGFTINLLNIDIVSEGINIIFKKQ